MGCLTAMGQTFCLKFRQTETVVEEAAFINITLGQAQYSEEAMQHTKHQHHFLSTLWKSYPFTGLALRLLPLKAPEQWDSKDASNRMHHCLPKQTTDTSDVLTAAWTHLAGYARIQNQDSPSEPQKDHKCQLYGILTEPWTKTASNNCSISHCS